MSDDTILDVAPEVIEALKRRLAETPADGPRVPVVDWLDDSVQFVAVKTP